jgi:hypothetical protein
MEWLIWWATLCAATAFNTAAWAACARALARRESLLPPETRRIRRQVLALSAIYVLGCGFRSLLPMIDVPRICLHDTWISRIAVGRSVATVAELAFVLQWALLMREAAVHGTGVSRVAARLLVPVIVTAELFSWGAALTRNNLLHAVENSLWTFDAVIAVAAFLSLRGQAVGAARRFLDAGIACAAGYVAFMVSVDVPMYLARWQTDVAEGVRYLSLGAGVEDLLARCVVERDWGAWREDALWLTLYFTIAVWISIALALAPPLAAHGLAGRKPMRPA